MRGAGKGKGWEEGREFRVLVGMCVFTVLVCVCYPRRLDNVANPYDFGIYQMVRPSPLGVRGMRVGAFRTFAFGFGVYVHICVHAHSMHAQAA